MSEQISERVRQQVASRADFRCEYCRIKEEDSFLNFQIDHIINKKHGGGDEVENLAYACPHCNQNKGADLTQDSSGIADCKLGKILISVNSEWMTWKA